MDVGTKTGRGPKPLIPTRRPSKRERVLYFGVGIVGGIILVALALTLDWSRSSLLLSSLVFVAAYVLVATPLLLGRRTDR